MRDRARTMDVPVSRLRLDTPWKALVVAIPVSLVSSAERVVFSVVSVPISTDSVVAVEYGNANCSTVEGGFAVSSEMVDGKLENGK